MAITVVNRTDTFDQWRVKTNTIADDLGDKAILSTTDKSSLVAATNELKTGVGSFSLTNFTATDLTAALNELRNSAITFYGAKTFNSALVAGSTLNSVGTFTVNTDKFSVAASSGNTLVAGTLGVSGISSLAALNATTGSFSSTLASTGNLTVNTDKFVVTAASGNTAIAGSLSVTGISTLTGAVGTSSTITQTVNIAPAGVSTVYSLVNTNAAYSSNSSRVTFDSAGNVVIQGNLSVTGSANFTSTTYTPDWSVITNKSFYGRFSDGTTTASSSGDNSIIRFRGSNGVTVAVTDNDPTFGDNLLISLSSVPNASLANSSVTVTAGTGLSGGGAVSLGGSITLTNAGVTSNVAGTGISLSGSTGAVTITNSDRGSSQNIFKTVAVSGQSNVVAASNSDTLTFVAGSNISLTTDATGKSVTINGIAAAANNGTITISAGTGISGGGSFTVDQAGPSTLTITNSDRGSSQSIFKNIAVAGQTTIVADNNDDTLTIVAGQVDTTVGITLTTDAATDTLTITHGNTSTLSGAQGGSGISSITVDTYGHVTAVGTATYLTGNQTITLSGDISGSGATSIITAIGAGKVTNAMLAGSISNDKLVNSTISGVALGSSLANLTISTGLTLDAGTTYNGSAGRTLTLAASGVGAGGTVGSSSSIPVITYDTYGRITGITTAASTPANNGTLTLNVSGTGLSGSASFTANQAGNSTFTVTSNATNLNTASTIVARDASGNFSAGTITATLNGNASSASSVAWTNVSGRPTAVSAFTNDSGYVTSASLPTRASLGLATTDAVTFGSVTAGSFNATSSLRYKENIRDIGDVILTIKNLRPIVYDRKDGSARGELGLIAEEVQAIVPAIVGLDAQGQANSVEYSRVSVLLLKAVQDILTRLEKLESKVN